MKIKFYFLKRTSPYFLTVLFFLSSLPIFSQEIVSFLNDTDVAIPDNDGAWASTTIPVAGIPEDYHIYFMDTGVHLEHTYAGDIEIVLTDPSNTFSLGLVDRPGVPDLTFGSSANFGQLNIFSDYQTVSSELMGNGLGTNDIITGNFIPSWIPGSFATDYSDYEDLLSSYTGNKNGDWILWVKDNATGDTGIINYVDMLIGYDRYCVPFMNNSFEHITNVSFNEINEDSGQSDVRYPVYNTIFTGGPSATVSQGETYPLSVTISPDSDEYIYAFFDWNQDGDFEDAGETYTVASNVDTAGPHTVDITVPAGATPGETRMRIFLGYDDATPDPCRTNEDGEVEDYSVVVGVMGVEDLQANQTKVYPNPVVDIVNISSKNTIENVMIYNLTGQEVLVEKANGKDVAMNLSSLPSGAYVAKIKTDAGVETVKIIKK